MEEGSLDPNTMTNQPTTTKPKGGLRTMPFIIANEAFERVASFGLTPNMIFYLTRDYHMDVATGTSVLSLWSAASNFLPVGGAFVSDSYLGRFRTISLGCFVSLLGMVLLWLTAMIPEARPPNCNPPQSCKSATTTQLFFLYASLMIMSIGAGGIRPCSLAFGAEQLGKDGNPTNQRVLQTFFNWYYASTTVSILIALTVIVYVQDHLGWKVGFAIPAICMFMSTVFFLLASSIYMKAKPNKSLFVGFAQVAVAAVRNRHIALPPTIEEGCYHKVAGSMVMPSEKLRFLNKACIIRNHEKDFNTDGSVLNPWSLCTVEQVEELKAVLKVIPLWSTGVVMAVSMNQQSFPVLQVSSMDRHLISHFAVPAGSFTMFLIITIVIWIPIYDRLIVPLVAKITGNPNGLSLKQRMGIGIVISCVMSALSAIVEGIRRSRANKQGFTENSLGIIDMSAWWLVPQFCLGGFAEAFNAIAQNEFYYSQFPKSMSSIATCLFGLGMGFGNLIVGLMVNIVDNTTKRGGKESWVSSNLNKGHLDYYYWLLTVICGINIIYYIFCAWAYGPLDGPSDGERTRIQNEDEGMKEEEELRKSRELQMVSSVEGMKEEELCKSRELQMVSSVEGMKEEGRAMQI